MSMTDRSIAYMGADAVGRLSERIAIVTGAGRGIGAGIAGRLADEGARVVCVDIDGSAAEQTAGGCGGGASSRQLDVSDSSACDALVAAVADEHGRIDILVNNAGINRDAMAHKMTDTQWHQVLAVDLSAVFFLCRAAARVMRPQGAGRIVNISSASWMGNIGQANYAAAKAGVVGLSRTLSKELARNGITVNALCPGFIQTDMTSAMPAEIHAAQIKKIPLGRIGTPTDVGNLVAFLASDDASYITGEVINIGGGYQL
jgi:NAD(P)-dependent dehydrogenase (short-subunit alcohol dehydrogenase family)